MNWYYSGWPYSDELYHHGIKGQKWGVRRYQNEDGSLTTLGKMRYGVVAVGKFFGKGAKAVGGAVSKTYKKRHPKKMSDEEIQSAIKRLEMEKRYRDLIRDSKPAVSRGKKIVGDIFESTAKTIANRTVQEGLDKLFEKPEKETMSSKMMKDFEKALKDDYKNGSVSNKFSYEKVKDTADYLEQLRKIEGSNQGGKKGGKGKK